MKNKAGYIFFGLIVIVGLYFTSHYDYLLFHSLIEFFSITVSVTIFFITWNTRKIISNGYLVFLGIAYLFIGSIDLMHTLSYKGMNIFTDYDYYANQLWIGGRFMESISLLAGILFVKKKELRHPYLTIAGFSAATALLFASVFVWKNFPVCFVDGTGLTEFKKVSEYIICGILAAGIGALIYYRNKFDKNVYLMLLFSLIITIASELFFTLYIDNYGITNLIGHYFKLASFYLIYRAIIKTGLNDPYRLLFRELKQSETRFRELSDLLPISVFETDITGKIIYYNKSLEEMFRLYANNHPQELRIQDLIKAGDSEILSIMREKRILGLESEAARDKNTKIPALISTAPIVDDETILGIRGLIIDISRQKEQERLLTESNRDLEQFAYAVSHDLKAPLHTMTGFLGMIEEKINESPKIDTELLEFIGFAANAGKRMGTLIKDLIDYSRIGSAKKDYSQFPLNSAVQDAILNQKINIDERNAAVTVGELPGIYGDISQISRLMQNLIGNALKYAKPDTPPKISITSEESGDFHRITVADNGVGMEKKFFEKIFEPFQRLVSNDEVEGSGIGLSVCRKIVERHGGKIWVESKLGEGSSFIFTLPLSRPDAS
ncbi:MAG: PAS domain S-box protein [Brevinematales bacterium]|nr:PAS domain S-box protein [Brevinematales bacterium]